MPTMPITLYFGAIFIFSTCVLSCHSKLQVTKTSHEVTKESMLQIPTFTLSTNITIPLVGLGSASGVAYDHVVSAIEAGFRFVDTAQSYSWGYREDEVGQAVFDAQRRWEDWHDEKGAPMLKSIDGSFKHGDNEYVFVQTKIHPQDLGYHSTQKAITLSLQRLQVTSIDSVLLHKPRCWGDICPNPPEGTWHDSWTALEEAFDTGIVRSIGICDVDVRLLGQLLEKRVGPTIIQNWFDPFHQDKEVRRRIASINEEQDKKGLTGKKILYQGYSTLGSQWKHFKGYTENPVMTHPILRSIASEYNATVPQVVIQWATRSGVMVLPASRNRSHQLSNLNSFYFELSEKDVRAIDDLDGNPPPLPPKKEPNPDEVRLQFANDVDVKIHVYWVPDGKIDVENSKDHVRVGEMNNRGDVLKLTSYHGHTFVFKEDGGTGRTLNYHTVDKSLGATQNHDIKISEEL